jgi:hypothetical protein
MTANFSHEEITTGAELPGDDDRASQQRDRAMAELPPVEPPSAGFIVQLFVVPALIVVVVVGAWAAFGKLASSKQDLEHLVRELQSGNPQRKQRAALELAQLIRADEELGERGQRLVENAEFARVISQLLRDGLNATSPSDEELQHQAFLARTLGFLDQPKIVLPVLVEALEPRFDSDVRKVALGSITLIAGRLLESKDPLHEEATVSALIGASRDNDPVFRQMSAYALGLLTNAESKQQLRVLLQDRDDLTGVNAAIGLARRGSTEGLELFLTHFEKSTSKLDASQLEQLTAQERALRIEDKMRTEPIVLKNAFKALTDLKQVLDNEQRVRVVQLVSPIAEAYPNMAIQIEARKMLLAFEKLD